MAQYFAIHPHDPQQRLIRRAVDIVRKGGLMVYPTDSCYALGCHIGDKGAMERVRRIRQVDEHHHFTLVCRDLSEIGQYAIVGNGRTDIELDADASRRRVAVERHGRNPEPAAT